MRSRQYIQCDVFTCHPTKGNGLAVVIDSEDLSDAQLQAFAAWTNLAETTFIYAPTNPEADYRLRIFTPTREMLFAGHPTLGSCAAWLHTGGKPRQSGLVRQECGVGIVEIDISSPIPAFVAPATLIEPLSDRCLQSIIHTLGIDPRIIRRTAKLDNGPVWQVLELERAQDVLAVDAALVRWPEFKAIGLIGAYPQGAECQYEVRMLAPSSGMSEDPITGSLGAAIAHWMAQDERLPEKLIISQGQNIGREGRIYVRTDPQDHSRVLIGGQTQILIEGRLRL